MRHLYFSIAIGAVSTLFGASPAAAQWDPGLVAQGQVLSGTARGYAERGGWRDSKNSRQDRDTARTCASIPQFRKRWGGKHPKVVQLTRLCRQAGY